VITSRAVFKGRSICFLCLRVTFRILNLCWINRLPARIVTSKLRLQLNFSSTWRLTRVWANTRAPRASSRTSNRGTFECTRKHIPSTDWDRFWSTTVGTSHCGHSVLTYSVLFITDISVRCVNVWNDTILSYLPKLQLMAHHCNQLYLLVALLVMRLQLSWKQFPVKPWTHVAGSCCFCDHKLTDLCLLMALIILSVVYLRKRLTNWRSSTNKYLLIPMLCIQLTVYLYSKCCIVVMKETHSTIYEQNVCKCVLFKYIDAFVTICYYNITCQ